MAGRLPRRRCVLPPVVAASVEGFADFVAVQQFFPELVALEQRDGCDAGSGFDLGAHVGEFGDRPLVDANQVQTDLAADRLTHLADFLADRGFGELDPEMCLRGEQDETGECSPSECPSK